MTPNEAFEILGVAPDASADEIRRAYLRALPNHKPERDPEGFHRLREAFETASAVATIRDRVGPGSIPVPTSGEDEAVPLGELFDPSGPYAWVADDAPSHGEANRRVAVAARTAVDGPPGEVVTVIREAADLAVRQHQWVSFDALLRAVLRLQARGHDREAAEVMEVVAELRDGHLDAFWAIEPEVVYLSIVVRELAALDYVFPTELKREIAAAAAAPFDPDRPGDLIQEMVLQQPHRAATAARELAARAPSLHRLYGHLLSGPGSDGDPGAVKRWAARLVVILAVLALPQIVRDCGDTRRAETVGNMRIALQELTRQTADVAGAGLERDCTEASPEAPDCGLGYALLDAYGNGRCEEAADWLDQLRQSVGSGAAAHVSSQTLDHLQSLDRLVCLQQRRSPFPKRRPSS